MTTFTLYGPGDPVTWGRQTGHTLDPRTTWEPSDEAEEYCPDSCTELHGLECHRYSLDLETDKCGPLRCTECITAN